VNSTGSEDCNRFHWLSTLRYAITAKRRWERDIVRLPTLRKWVGTAFGTARLGGVALSADDALLFRSVRPLHHGGDGETVGSMWLHLRGCARVTPEHGPVCTPCRDDFRPLIGVSFPIERTSQPCVAGWAHRHRRPGQVGTDSRGRCFHSRISSSFGQNAPRRRAAPVIASPPGSTARTRHDLGACGCCEPSSQMASSVSGSTGPRGCTGRQAAQASGKSSSKTFTNNPRLPCLTAGVQSGPGFIENTMLLQITAVIGSGGKRARTREALDRSRGQTKAGLGNRQERGAACEFQFPE